MSYRAPEISGSAQIDYENAFDSLTDGDNGYGTSTIHGSLIDLTNKKYKKCVKGYAEINLTGAIPDYKLNRGYISFSFFISLNSSRNVHHNNIFYLSTGNPKVYALPEATSYDKDEVVIDINSIQNAVYYNGIRKGFQYTFNDDEFYLIVLSLMNTYVLMTVNDDIVIEQEFINGDSDPIDDYSFSYLVLGCENAEFKISKLKAGFEYYFGYGDEYNNDPLNYAKEEYNDFYLISASSIPFKITKTSQMISPEFIESSSNKMSIYRDHVQTVEIIEKLNQSVPKITKSGTLVCKEFIEQ